MNRQNKSFWTCLWLAIIAFVLLLGVILIAAYIYKFDPLSAFSQLFSTDASVIWSAIGVAVTAVIGFMTIKINDNLREVQEKQVIIQQKQAEIASRQNQLYSEPHVMLESIKVKKVAVERTEDSKQIKRVKDFDHPYYVNREDNIDFKSISVIEIQFRNTSEAFARLRFKEATIKSGTESGRIVASFNGSTFGYSATQEMLDSGSVATIGLVIETSKIPDLRHTTITISAYLDNNFKETYIDTQTYHISGECEGVVQFYPRNLSKNIYEKIEKS